MTRITSPRRLREEADRVHAALVAAEGAAAAAITRSRTQFDWPHPSTGMWKLSRTA
jgi:hypothetical protein